MITFNYLENKILCKLWNGEEYSYPVSQEILDVEEKKANVCQKIAWSWGKKMGICRLEGLKNTIDIFRRITKYFDKPIWYKKYKFSEEIQDKYKVFTNGEDGLYKFLVQIPNGLHYSLAFPKKRLNKAGIIVSFLNKQGEPFYLAECHDVACCEDHCKTTNVFAPANKISPFIFGEEDDNYNIHSELNTEYLGKRPPMFNEWALTDENTPSIILVSDILTAMKLEDDLKGMDNIGVVALINAKRVVYFFEKLKTCENIKNKNFIIIGEGGEEQTPNRTPTSILKGLMAKTSIPFKWVCLNTAEIISSLGGEKIKSLL